MDGKLARLESLDALRGFDMLFISGLSGLVIALCGVFGFPEGFVAEQMRHTAWTGLHHHDTIFPLFIFMAGVSWPFSLAVQRARGRSTLAIVWKVVRRAIVLTLLAACMGSLLTFDWPNIRYLDVLNTIGICGGIAALLYMFVPSVMVRLVICAGILLGYWALLRFCPAPDALTVSMPASPEWQGTGPFSLVGNLCGYVDRCLLPGEYYTCCDATGRGIFEEDGILRNFSAIATAMLGVFAGEIVRNGKWTGERRTVALLVAALGCLLLTLIAVPFCPVIMKIWSPTFVLANGAYSFAMLAVFYWVIDVRGWKGWSSLLQAVGMNSIAIYLLNRTGLMGAVAEWCFGATGWVPAGLLALNMWLMWYLREKKVFVKV